MSTTSLTAKYRPQNFAQVAGQEAVKSILSRAALTNRVAPAYLFSGTRGVGKTTIARIFAKALNCEKAPAAEPCNECLHCRQITAGVAPDVIEIDGASNRGIEDARRLKEDIGYAPLESRYKVFIIDEAHMLTREAFNALLKTLEEPPPRVTFILATTEAHKFPATIISRCQHYSFKMLPQQELAAHLASVLEREQVAFEPGALNILARRGAGSVRDSMSLLGQALAFCSGELREEDVRSFLGLAGQDVFFSIMEALHGRDLVSVGLTLRSVLDQGLDLGFFLREFTNCWRNMFLLRQSGEAALPLLDLSGEEARMWMDWAGRFEPAHIHASWQMTLEGQRRVMGSLEPAMALELLLFNLASLPDLLNLENPAVAARGAAPASAPTGGQGMGPGGQRSPGSFGSGQGGMGPGGSGPAGGAPRGGFGPGQQGRGAAPQASGHAHPATPPHSPAHAGGDVAHGRPVGAPPVAASAALGGPAGPGARPQGAGMYPDGEEPPLAEPDPEGFEDGSFDPEFSSLPPAEMREADMSPPPPEADGAFEPKKPAPARRGGAAVESAPSGSIVSPQARERRQREFVAPGPPTGGAFLEFVQSKNGSGEQVYHPLTRASSLEYLEPTLVVTCDRRFLMKRLEEKDRMKSLVRYAREYFGPQADVRLALTEGEANRKSADQVRGEAESSEAVRLAKEIFKARLLEVDPR